MLLSLGAELASVSLDAPVGLDGDDFLLDGCAAIVNTVEGGRGEDRAVDV